MADISKGKIVRYVVIASIYNLILSAIVYFADWLNDEFFQFKWQNWDLASWWLFIAANAVLFGTLLFFAPYFERFLYFKLESIQKKLNIKEK